MTSEEKRELLEFAEEAVRRAVFHESPPPVPQKPVFQSSGGAFVTLKRNGRLRGCIGHFAGMGTLGETVRAMAREAALGDPRFPGVTPGEFPVVSIEISVLSPMERIAPEDVIPGIHGLFVTRGSRRGTLLPQVASEEGWDRETFLAHTCLKAGLSPNAWKDPQTELFAYTAQVISQ